MFGRLVRSDRRITTLGRWTFVVMLVLAVATPFVVAHLRAPRPVAPAAGSTLPGPDGRPTVVYAASLAHGCAYATVDSARPAPGGILIAENVCEPEAGDERAPSPIERLVLLAADGSATLVDRPPGATAHDRLQVLAGDGSVALVLVEVARDHRQVLYRWHGADGWTAVLEAGGAHGHAGDDGPVSRAQVEPIRAAAFAPDGGIVLMEQFAVRRVSPGGVITTLAGSADRDRASDDEVWGAGGIPSDLVTGGYRPLPAGPTPARDFALPTLTAMDVAGDGTVWLASNDAVLRLGTDGLLAPVSTSETVVPDAPAARLVGVAGSSSRLTGLLVRGQALLVLDSWSQRILRQDGQRLQLVLGRPETERASCPAVGVGGHPAPTRICAYGIAAGPAGSLLVVTDDGVVAVPDIDDLPALSSAGGSAT